MVLTIGPGKVSGVTGSEAAEAVEQAAVVTADAVGSAPSVTSVTSDTSAPVAGPGRGGGYQPMIRDMPQGERPRERLRDYGPKLLSNTELIAILLRTGIQGENVLAMSNRLLTHFKGLDGLGRSTFAELCAERGLSEAKTCQLMAALELGRRFISLAPHDRAVINSPQDVANLLQAEMAALEQEHLRVLLLNTKNQVLRTEEVYVGNVNSSISPAGGGIPPGGAGQCAVHHHRTQSPLRRPDAQPGGCEHHPGVGRGRQAVEHRTAGPSGNRQRRPIRKPQREKAGLRLGKIRLGHCIWAAKVPGNRPFRRKQEPKTLWAEVPAFAGTTGRDKHPNHGLIQRFHRSIDQYTGETPHRGDAPTLTLPRRERELLKDPVQLDPQLDS